MGMANIGKDGGRKGKKNLRGVKVGNHGQTEDRIGGFISPFFETLGRIVMRPKEVLEAAHLSIA